MSDPFDLNQYVTSFNKSLNYSPDPLGFTGFSNILIKISQAIKMRQAAVHVGYGVPESSFTNVERFDSSTPSSLSSAITLFQDAIKELVEGTLIDSYGRLQNCTSLSNPYVGFFNSSEGLPIVGLINIIESGTFSDPPDPSTIDRKSVV